MREAGLRAQGVPGTVFEWKADGGRDLGARPRAAQNARAAAVTPSASTTPSVQGGASTAVANVR